MTRSELIKVRVSPKLKGLMVRIADDDRTTVSDLVRDLMQQLATGRSVSPEVRNDMAAVRQLANLVLALAEAVASDQEVARKLAEVGRRLRDLASRHLGQPS